MCGIAGIFGSSFNKPIPLAALRHRGPDSEGIWTDPEDKIWLGHTRLSILDLSEAGRQPMECEDGRYYIIFNGEIYNFLELRKELQDKGYVFHTETDTEIIAAAYDSWGVECLHRFNGMWAFALWDTRKSELWLARDRFGEKPLYYYVNKEEFAFASEVQALHFWLGNNTELDSEVVRSICTGKFEWHGTDRTYLANVNTLPAGHYLIKTRDSLKVHRWYRLEPNCVTVPRSMPDQTQALHNLLTDACRLRLRSDVPVATCLSGGLDSSAITAIVHKGIFTPSERSAKDFHRAFCAAFPNTILDETAKARLLAHEIGAELMVYEIRPPSGERLLKAISTCDGPMHSLAFYPIWELYGFINKNGIKVTLDGQGPDEMMGGYYETIDSALRSALSQGKVRWFWDIYKTYSGQGESQYRSSRAFARAKLFNVLKTPLSQLKRFILRQFVHNSNSRVDHLEYIQPIPSNLKPLSSELYSQFCQKQLPTILQQFDRCSMAHGVECRMPFMDYRVVEFVFSLPEESLVGDGFTKRVLREAVRGLVPESICSNSIKIGFNAPIVEWFLGPLREVILDTMRGKDFRQNGFFDGQRLAKQFEIWLNAPNWGDAWAFWPPIHFALWQSQLRASLSSSKAMSTGTYGLFQSK